MDKLGVSPHIREHNKQTMRYVNQHDEIYFQMEDDEGEDFDKTKIWKVINYGKIGKAKDTQIDSSSKTGEKYQQMDDGNNQKEYKLSQKINQDEDFNTWIEKIANQ